MTSAEFKTIRQTIGFTAQEFAEHLNVGTRTIQRIENGVTVPEGYILKVLEDYYSKFLSILTNTKDQVSQFIKDQGYPKDLVLLRYKKEDFKKYNPLSDVPHQIHNAVIGHLLAKFESQAVPVGIVYFEPESYFKWLSEREDGQPMRSAWAVFYHSEISQIVDNWHNQDWNSK